MTIGIYILVFNGTDKCYIGQSRNIEYRFTQHLYKLKNNTCSVKMLEAYKLFGAPSLEILCKCEVAELDTLEKYYIKEFDSVDAGFNTYFENRGVPTLERKRGEDSATSIYPNYKIAEVLFYLTDCPEMRAIDISAETGVGVSTVRSISCLNNHKWLKDVYPDKYSILESLKGMGAKSNKYSAKSRGITYPAVVSPEGVMYSNITNVKHFCEVHNLTPSNMGALLNGKRKSHKGWKVCQEEQV